jgi:hypothetical protein
VAVRGRATVRAVVLWEVSLALECRLRGGGCGGGGGACL